LPASSFHLVDEWLISVAADENLLIIAQIMPFSIYVPISNWWLLRLGGLLHALQKFITGTRQSNLALLLLFLCLLLFFFLLLLVLLPRFDLISIFLGLIFSQLLLLELQGFFLLFS